ncbi:Endonuclease/exonuclease/phosphatase [Dipodascopsis uninucleata]
MTSHILTTSTHSLEFFPPKLSSSGAVIAPPSYILTKSPADQVNDEKNGSSESNRTPIDLTVHDTITIEEDNADPEVLLIKLQDTPIGTLQKSDNISLLADFLSAWRSALALLEDQIQVKSVGEFEDPMNSDYITTRLTEERDSFVEEKTIFIRLVTWNLHGEVIGEDLRPMLYGSQPEIHDHPGLFFVALQEADPLSPKTLYANQATVARWTNQILDVLDPDYVAVTTNELIGMILLVFSHKKIASQVSNIEISTAGTGVLGYWGNKGGVCVRFRLGDTHIEGLPGVEIAVVNMHLSSGLSTQSVERRRWELSELDKRLNLPKFNGRLFRKQRNGGKNRKELLFQNGDLLEELDERGLEEEAAETVVNANGIDDDYISDKPSNSSFSGNVSDDASAVSGAASTIDSDRAGTTSTSSTSVMTLAATLNSDNVGFDKEFNSIVFVLGDLNYRLSMDRLDVAQMVEKKDYDALLFWDQLRNEIKEGSVLVGFQEGTIKFQPSYKYDLGKYDVFDSSEKARVPAYTDRIFYTPYPTLTQLSYDSFMHYISSDHKPVASSFLLKILMTDMDKRAAIVKTLLRDMDVRENESRPKVDVEQTELICQNLEVLTTETQIVRFRNYGNTQVAWEIEQVDKSVLNFNIRQGVLPPGAKQSIRVSFLVPVGESNISEIFILRIINRQDYFISVSGNILPSAFGASLDEMIHKPSGARNEYLPQNDIPQLNIPREIWKCVDYLSTRISKEIFRHPGDDTVGHMIRNWLDTGSEFDITVLDTLNADGNKGTNSIAEQFLLLLELTNGGVIPEIAYPVIIKGASGIDMIFDSMPRVNINTLIYVASFLREVRNVVFDFEYILEIFDKVLIRVPRGAKNGSRAKSKRIDFLKAFIGK